MRRIKGNIGILPVECINQWSNKYRVRWDIRPDDASTSLVTFVEQQFDHKPTIDEIKAAVLAWHNEQINEQIVSGFEWRGNAVWLSTENQFNYKAAYDLAVQSNGESLPVVFKFGTTEQPTYYQFVNLTDLSDFYLSAMAFINGTLAEGWRTKDAIDWSQWSQYL